VRRLLATLLVVMGTAGTGVLWAYFTAGAVAGSHGRAAAGTLQPVKTPSVSLSERGVVVTWAKSSPSTGYTVARYAESGGEAIEPGSACDGLQKELACIETEVPTGRWVYTVTPRDYGWIGAESDRSASIAIAPAAPTDVTLANGPYVNDATEDSVTVEVFLASTSLSSDTVQLTISDGAGNVTAIAHPPLDGATAVHFTGIDVASLADGPLTFTAQSTSSYGDDSSGTSHAYSKDTVAPTVTVTPSRSADHGTWFNHAVTYTPSGTDGTSGVASCQPPLVYSEPDGTGLTVQRTCIDNAGNTGTGTSSVFEYDGTGPTVTLNPDRSPDRNGWYNHALTFTPTGTDTTSGISSCESTLVYNGPDGTELTVSRTCTNNAGGTATGTSAPFDFDQTGPNVTVSSDRPPDANGWYNHPVTWTASGTDASSGIGSCESLAYSGTDAAGVQVGRHCTDNAGNTELGLSVPFNYDGTKPVVRAAIVDTATGLSGYLRPGSTYVVYAEVTDATSGVTTSLTADVEALSATGVTLVFSAEGFTVANVDGSTSTYHYKSAQLTALSTLVEGATYFTVSAQDDALNSATTGRGDSPAASVTVDNTGPTVSVILAPGQGISSTTQP
jgi:hypothetical protein